MNVQNGNDEYYLHCQSEEYQQSRAYTRRPSFVPTDWLTDVWLQDVVKLSSYSWILGLQAVTGPYQSRVCRRHSRVSGSVCSDSLIIVHCTIGMQEELYKSTLHCYGNVKRWKNVKTVHCTMGIQEELQNSMLHYRTLKWKQHQRFFTNLYFEYSALDMG